MLSEFLDSEIDFLLVGAYAMAAHGYPRSTGDMDLWVRADPDTGPKTFSALTRFGAPLHDLTAANLSTPGLVFQIGVPPIRNDILTMVSGLDFQPAWANRMLVEWDGLVIPVLGLSDHAGRDRRTSKGPYRRTIGDREPKRWLSGRASLESRARECRHRVCRWRRVGPVRADTFLRRVVDALFPIAVETTRERLVRVHRWFFPCLVTFRPSRRRWSSASSLLCPLLTTSIVRRALPRSTPHRRASSVLVGIG